MSEEHYATDDLIVGGLSLPIACEIRIDITDEEVNLQVGQRDWQWKRGHPDTCSAGTTLIEPIPFDPDNLPTEFPESPDASRPRLQPKSKGIEVSR